MGKKRKLFNCLIFLIYMVLGSAVFFGIKGYGMYREAIKEEPIDLRIEKIRSQKDFVGVWPRICYFPVPARHFSISSAAFSQRSRR